MKINRLSFTKFIDIKAGLIWMAAILWTTPQLAAHEQYEDYIEPGEKCIYEELIEGCEYDNMYFCQTTSEYYDHAAALCTYQFYKYYAYDENGEYYSYDKYGGYYMGDLVVPSEVYGLFPFIYGEDQTFTVVAVANMYKNGLTSLYLPETIERISNTIEECRYLERVHLNNSLRVLNGVKNCHVLTECPLPLSLEEIGDGWMSGIPIRETSLPESLRVIGEGCFCRLSNLREITIPETLVTLGAGSFSECPVLERITLPSTPILSEGSFSGCPAVRVVKVYAQTPYEIPDGCMADINKAKCSLYVPEGCEEAYQNADGWKEFGMITRLPRSDVNAVSADRGDWRAFASHGLLVIDSTVGHEITVHSLAGQHMATVEANGRSELSLPKGMYVVSSHGKTVKVRL